LSEELIFVFVIHLFYVKVSCVWCRHASGCAKILWYHRQTKLRTL